MSAEETLWICERYSPPLRDAGLGTFEQFMRTGGRRELDKPSLAGWRQRVEVEAGGEVLFLKRYRRPPWARQLVDRLRGFTSSADVERRWIRRLASLGIGVPRVVAFGERRLGPVERESLLLTGRVPGQSLERWLPEHLDELREGRFRGRLSSALAALVARLHGAGLFHRDLYASHLFVERGPSGAFTLYLIDLQRVIRPRWLRRRWRVKDLAALNYSIPRSAASTADRLRWLKRYRNVDRLGPAERRLIRAVRSKTRRIARHSAKHALG